MKTISIDEIRALDGNLGELKKKVSEGDSSAQLEMALYQLYVKQDANSCLSYLEKASASGDAMSFLLLGYLHEHAIGTSKNYTEAVNNYVKGYDLLNNTVASKGNIDKDGALKEMNQQYDKQVDLISKLITSKGFCTFQDDHFLFPWSSETRKTVKKNLPILSRDIAKFGQLYHTAITDLSDTSSGLWTYRYQDCLLMPLEVMKTLAARDYLEQYFGDNGFLYIPADPYFNNALGRCLIDDEDAHDNDFIISGLLQMAGHDNDPLWQYRVGLWYEFCDNNLEPKTAAFWYEKAKELLSDSMVALNRVKNSLQYRILDDIKYGTPNDCQLLSNRTLKNPQNSIGWVIESALRGDETAMQRLERNQLSLKRSKLKLLLRPTSSASSGKPSSVLGGKYNSSDLMPYYSFLVEESSADKQAIQLWFKNIQKEQSEQSLCESLCKDILDANQQLGKLKKKWTDDVCVGYQQVIGKLRNALTNFEQELKTNHMPWWKIPFFVNGTESPDDCISNEQQKKDEFVENFEMTEKWFDNIPGKVKTLMDLTKIKSDNFLLEERLIIVNKLLHEAERKLKRVDTEINSIEMQITQLKDGSAAELTQLRFSWERTCFSVFLLWLVLSLILYLFTSLPYSNISFVLCCWCLGGFIYGKLQGYSIKKILKGALGGSIIALLLLIPLSSLKVNNDDSVSNVSDSSSFGTSKISDADDFSESEDIEEDNQKDELKGKYDYVYSAESNGWRKVEKNGKIGFIDKKGNVVVKPKYDYVHSSDANGWRKVELNDKKGFIDKNGNEIVEPKYDYVHSSDANGWRKVELNDKKGFIDNNGKEVVPVIYDYIYSWSGGLAKVEKDGKIGYINREGKLVQPLE